MTSRSRTATDNYTVPSTAKWLTDREKAFIQARLPPNAPRADELNFNFREIVSSLKDSRLWLFTLIWALFTVGTAGVTFFQPTVIANLGYTYVFSIYFSFLFFSFLFFGS